MDDLADKCFWKLFILKLPSQQIMRHLDGILWFFSLKTHYIVNGVSESDIKLTKI